MRVYIKSFCIILCLLLLLMLCGCSGRTNQEVKSKRMEVIYEDWYISIYRDNETGVQYIRNGNGGFCVMVDENGQPYTGKYSSK